MYSFCTHIRHSEGFFEGSRTLLCSYCDTQTHTHTQTQRQSILDKYMINFLVLLGGVFGQNGAGGHQNPTDQATKEGRNSHTYH